MTSTVFSIPAVGPDFGFDCRISRAFGAFVQFGVTLAPHKPKMGSLFSHEVQPCS